MVAFPSTASILIYRLSLFYLDHRAFQRPIVRARVFLSLVPVIIYLFALSHIPLPAALASSDTTTIALSRLIVLGTIILGLLSGFGAISSSWQFLPFISQSRYVMFLFFFLGLNCECEFIYFIFFFLEASLLNTNLTLHNTLLRVYGMICGREKKRLHVGKDQLYDFSFAFSPTNCQKNKIDTISRQRQPHGSPEWDPHFGEAIAVSI